MRVSLTLDGHFARIKPMGHLGGDLFTAYRKASEGAIYDATKKANFATLDKVPGIIKRLREADFPIDLDVSLEDALSKQEAQVWLDVQAAKERAELVDAEIKAMGKPGLFPFQQSGVVWLAQKSGALLADEMGLGKGNAVSEPVLTPSGWRQIGDLVPGDMVIGADGLPTVVQEVFPRGRQQIYRVTLTDGTWSRVDSEHLWLVQTASDRFYLNPGRVMATKDLIAEGLRSKPSKGRKRGNSKWFVPVVKPVWWPSKKLTVHPYILGALLANGSLTQNSVQHSGDAEQREAMRAFLHSKERNELLPNQKLKGGCTSSILGRDERRGKLNRELKALGVKLKSSDKSVPEEYLFASIEQRRLLLAGLMDNDGTISKDGKVVEYNTTSKKLAEDVLSLVRSLGGVAWVSSRIPTFVYKGERKKGKRDYRVRMNVTFCPFHIPRKASRWSREVSAPFNCLPFIKYPPAHAIESIKKDGFEHSVCIRVAATDHLYVTRDFIVTHNTLQTLSALPSGASTLVISPAVAKGVWMREVRKWRPHLRVSVLKGKTGFRWPTKNEVVVVNYDVLPDVHSRSCLTRRKSKATIIGQHTPDCLKARANAFVPAVSEMAKRCKGCLPESDVAKQCKGCLPFLDDAPENMVLVADEAHALKNAKAQRSVKFKGLSEAVRHKGGRVWLLTATPLINRPTELWSVFSAAQIAQEAFGSFKQFVKLFDGKPSTFGGYSFGNPDTDAIAERLQRVMLRRLREEVMPELPRKTIQETEVEIDKKTIALANQYVKTHGGIDRITEQLSKGLAFDTLATVRASLASAKVPALMDLIADYEEQEEPLVVFSAHRAPIDLLAKRPGWAVITGDTPTSKRGEIEDEFQAGKLKGVGATIKAGGVAITLTRACHAVFVDLEWSPALNSQAEDRICRIGQTRPCLITVLVANHPLDERVSELLIQKRSLIDASVDAARDVPVDS